MLSLGFSTGCVKDKRELVVVYFFIYLVINLLVFFKRWGYFVFKNVFGFVSLCEWDDFREIGGV